MAAITLRTAMRHEVHALLKPAHIAASDLGMNADADVSTAGKTITHAINKCLEYIRKHGAAATDTPAIADGVLVEQLMMRASSRDICAGRPSVSITCDRSFTVIRHAGPLLLILKELCKGALGAHVASDEKRLRLSFAQKNGAGTFLIEEQVVSAHDAFVKQRRSTTLYPLDRSICHAAETAQAIGAELFLARTGDQNAAFILSVPTQCFGRAEPLSEREQPILIPVSAYAAAGR